MFKQILSAASLEKYFNKPVWNSWTVWGAFLYSFAGNMIQDAVELGLLTPEAGDDWALLSTRLGGFLTILGIRRAL